MHWCDSLRVHVMVHIFIICMSLICVVKSKFTHDWAVQIDGGEDVAKEIASSNNFEYLGKVFDDVFHFRHRRLAKRSSSPSPHYHKLITDHPLVRWAEQQHVKRRVKRDFQDAFKSPTAISELDRRRDAEEPHFFFSDPKWPSMWYLNRGGNLDMNVEKAWKLGITGKGIVVTILDDGLEKDHPDLVQNYDPHASYDVNGKDPDPEPRYDLLDSNRHGTRCAGEVAADANNSICAIGVAYEASVGGVRMLDGDVTDVVEATSLALNIQHIDIYSASWGPDDDGKTVDGPGQLATRAFIEGIKTGRKGKGSIFIWASGNGGRDQDNCNCDGYTNAIWTLSISSATENGRKPWYSEACSSTLASTYSSGGVGEKMIVTTDLHHGCTTAHTGTSASAPLAAGICALALQANTNITWRDMQHIVVRTARPENLDGTDWQINGVGRKVSHRFGYGLMDAYGMVVLAKNWTTVPPQRKCEVPWPRHDKLIPQKSYVTLQLEVSDCPGVNYLEHVQSKVTLIADRRGDMEIFLISPAGTKSTLLTKRPRDNSRTGFHTWPFMTVHMWGESPLGIWKLEIHNNGLFYSQTTTILREWTMIFHGTFTDPEGFRYRWQEAPRGTPSKDASSSWQWEEKLAPHHSSSPFQSSSSFDNVPPVLDNSPSLNFPPPRVLEESSSAYYNPYPIFDSNPSYLDSKLLHLDDSLPRLENNPSFVDRNHLILNNEKPILQYQPPKNDRIPTFHFEEGPVHLDKVQSHLDLKPSYLDSKPVYNNPKWDNRRPASGSPQKSLSNKTYVPTKPQFHPNPETSSHSLFKIFDDFHSSSSDRGGEHRKPQHRHKHKGKATVKDWSLLFYGTEVEPGQTTDNIVSLLPNNIDDSHESAHSVHVEGKRTEDRGSGIAVEHEPRNPQPGVPDNDSGHVPSSMDSSSAGRSPTPTPIPLMSVPQLALPPGCISIDVLGSCLECSSGLFLSETKCVDSCPIGYFVSEESANKLCLRCHYSCKTCSGPYDYQCLNCWDDSTLSKPQKDESFCYPSSLVNSMDVQSTWLKMTFALFLLLVLFVVGLAFFVLRNRKTKISFRPESSSMKNGPLMTGINLPKMNRTSYSTVSIEDSDKFMTRIPFHDSSSSDSEL